MTPIWHPCAEGEKLYQAYCAEVQQIIALEYCALYPIQPTWKAWHEWLEHLDHCEDCKIEREK